MTLHEKRKLARKIHAMRIKPQPPSIRLTVIDAAKIFPELLKKASK